MSVLLIGCGYWGQNWAKTLLEMDELGGICELDQSRYAVISEQYPTVPVFTRLEDALKHPGLDAVVLATPAETHTNLAKRCLLEGLSVLVEKPMTLTTEDAQALVALAQVQNKVLAVGHLLLEHPALLTLQQLIRDGDLGEILSVQCTRVNYGKVRDVENVWWSFAPHDLSILRMLLDEPFRPVQAIARTPLGRQEIPDTVFAAFETPSGKSASIHVSWFSPYKKHETVVMGTQKIAIFEDTYPLDTKLALVDVAVEPLANGNVRLNRGTVEYVPLEMPDDLLTRQAYRFLNAVRYEEPLQNTGENGLFVVEQLQAVQSLLDTQPSLVAGDEALASGGVR